MALKKTDLLLKGLPRNESVSSRILVELHLALGRAPPPPRTRNCTGRGYQCYRHFR